MNGPAPERPGYREPMVWLLVALLLASVLGSLTTLAIALRADGDEQHILDRPEPTVPEP